MTSFAGLCADGFRCNPRTTAEVAPEPIVHPGNHERNIISLECIDEGLGHAVGLRRSHRRKARHKADRLGEGDRLVSTVTAAVVREPLRRVRGLLSAKAHLDALEYQIADHLACDASGRGYPRDHFTIAGVERKGDTNALTVPAGNLEAIRRPSQVRADRDNLTVVCSTWRVTRIALQEETVLRHQAVNAFAVEPRKSCAFTLSIEQCPDPTTPICRLLIRQRSDRGQQLRIPGLLVSPSRATLFAKTRVQLRARDAECVGDRLHRKPSSGNDGKLAMSFFVRNIHRLPEDLILKRLLDQDSLELADASLKSFDLGGAHDFLIDPDRSLFALGHAPSPVEQQRGRNTMLPSHIGNGDHGLRDFLHSPQLLVDGIPSIPMDSRINLNTLCIRRHSRMTRLTPSSYLRQHCPVEMRVAPRNNNFCRLHVRNRPPTKTQTSQNTTLSRIASLARSQLARKSHDRS